MNEIGLMGYECSLQENTITENILKETMFENIHFIYEMKERNIHFFSTKESSLIGKRKGTNKFNSRW